MLRVKKHTHGKNKTLSLSMMKSNLCHPHKLSEQILFQWRWPFICLPSRFEMNLSSPPTPSDTTEHHYSVYSKGKKSTFYLSPSRNKWTKTAWPSSNFIAQTLGNIQLNFIPSVQCLVLVIEENIISSGSQISL